MKFAPRRRRINKLRVYLVIAVVMALTSIITALLGSTAGAVAIGVVALFIGMLYIAEVEDTIRYDGMMQFW